MRSPIVWFGGKGNFVEKLLRHLPETKIYVYVEVFGGAASLLFAKPPSPAEIYNDIDEGLHNFFRVISDPELFEQFYRRVALLPYSRQLYCECRDNWETEADRVKRAAMWFVVARQSFGGLFGNSWGFNVNASSRNMAFACSKWLSAIECLPHVHARLQRVQIENQDWRRILDTYDTPDTLFYLDPPYVPETRKDGGYKHELTSEDHEELVDRMLKLSGSSILSGYNSPIYEPLEVNGWKRYDYATACHAAGKTRHTQILGEGAALRAQARTESVWVKTREERQLSLFEKRREKCQW